MNSTDEREKVGDDLPRSWNVHGGPVLKLKNQNKKEIFTEFWKIRAPIDWVIIYNLEMYT